MTRDPATLLLWAQGCLWIAAITTTAFPVLYFFSPWYVSRIGRSLMVYGVAYALIVDTTLLFQYWHPDEILVLFWINAVMFSLVAFSATVITLTLWVTNYKHHKRIKEILK